MAAGTAGSLIQDVDSPEDKLMCNFCNKLRTGVELEEDLSNDCRRFRAELLKSGRS